MDVFYMVCGQQFVVWRQSLANSSGVDVQSCVTAERLSDLPDKEKFHKRI
jgi:hypothetical protein